ncbi:MAG: DNA polymerase III subunit delta' [Paracoccaceae bacterium]
MTDAETLPEFDRVEGAPHPRQTGALIGQNSAEAAFLDAFNSARLHHGWLISGPRGIGKATLAWRIARFLMATPSADTSGMFGDALPAPDTLDIAPDHPVNARIMALSEPALFLLRPIWDQDKKRFKSGITVDEVRKLKGFFNLSATDGGRRVVIIDCAEDMNTSAANALLKLLEEPPEDAVLLLISHQPSRLLPTIRSRCRELRCELLSADAMATAMSAAGSEPSDTAALTELATGSVGEAVRLTNLEGMQTYARIIDLFTGLPRLDRPKALKLAESAVGKGKQAHFDLLLRLLDLFLIRTARTGVSGPPLVQAAPGETELLKRLSPDADAGRVWAELQQTLSARARHGQAVNLDPAALILDMVFKINDTAAKLAAR